nr:N-acetylglucosamine-6-phosphate deacetylase [uncultured Sphaerochaeta sp.]
MQLFTSAMIILEDSILRDAYLVEESGLIMAFGPMPVPDVFSKYASKVYDCTGFYLSPGFVDIHTHGSGGHDYMDGTEEAFIGAAASHLQYGSTTLLPTTLASSDESLFKTFSIFQTIKKSEAVLPHLPGLHLEGPYFCHKEKGAMEENHLRLPAPEHYMNILERSQGTILRWSLAPELPGALEMADRVINEGIHVSAAHTCATYEEMSEAFDHGVNHLTHFYSAMSSLTRKDGMRILGVIESGYLIDGLTLEVIADGMHLPGPLLRLIYKCKDHDQICATTDSMRAAGMGPGPSILGPKQEGTPVFVEDGIAKMPDRTCFAGSVATCDRLVRVLMAEVGLSLEEAVKASSLLPARFMGLDQETGSIAIGKQADLLVFDQSISMKRVFVSGMEIQIVHA